MKKISKTDFANKVKLAVAAGNNGVENFGLFDLKLEKTTVHFKYCGKWGEHHMFSVIDMHDPYDGKSHGYPKIWEGDMEAFWAEFNRELGWIKTTHEPKPKNHFIKIEE